ncbi:hypothetical protein U91I_00308 [alpha proteobacterium U9-1i]|nr:hypothetical protein U91I_00308 [alpha proteobacterium U9-1i]
MAQQLTTARDTRISSRMFGIAETLFLLAGFSLIAGQLAPLIGVPTRSDRNALLFDTPIPQWFAAAEAEAQWLGLRFGLTLLAAWLICAWRRGPTRREAGLSFGDRSPLALIGLGLGVCLVVLIPVHVAQAIHSVHPLGANTPMWDLFARNEWTPDFWLFMAASSFVLVPIVEELFFRSYMVSRLRENFSAGGAVILSAILFWVSHGQYLNTDPYLMMFSISALIGASMLAWMMVYTGSVLPAVAAHMLLNIPGDTWYHVGWVIAGVAILICYRRTAARLFMDYARLIASTREWLLLVAVGAVMFALVLFIRSEPRSVYPVAGLFLLLALASLTRRRTNENSR